MALDIHFAKAKISPSELTSATKVREIDHYEHEQLLKTGVLDTCGILARLKDFYKDSKIYNSEIQQVLDSLEQFSEKDKENIDPEEPVGSIKKIFQKALTLNVDIHFIAD